MSLWYRLFPLVERQGLFLCQSAKVGLMQHGTQQPSPRFTEVPGQPGLDMIRHDPTRI
jgi:hypothetical protein